MHPPVSIAIFASGVGSNARNILAYLNDSDHVKVALLLSNNAQSGVPNIAAEFDIPFYIFNRADLYESDKVIEVLHSHNVKYIVLAGFLWLIPPSLIKAYPDRIINIHPALLPKFGGKGMYGMKVHEAVKQARETETGITIHLVNEEYDKGRVLFQEGIRISADDSVEDIAVKIHGLEYAHFPGVVLEYIKGQEGRTEH
jgi:phosphoribosylglycinamide formyltransferase-1